MKTQQNNVIELAFISSKEYSDPFNDITVTAVITDPIGTERRVLAFWAGGSTWKVRYSSALVGIHRYITECSEKDNKNLNGIIGLLEIEEYKGSNPLFLHGAVTRRGDDLFLRHADGEPFFYLADTWWMGFTKRLDWPNGFKILTQDRVEKMFSVVQIVAGLYPDMLPFDDRGANESGFPWDPNFQAINPAYFDEADKKIEWLVQNGIVPCIVGCWGFFMSFAGKAAVKRHWQYLIERWAAYPVMWCLAGEANMAFYDERVSYEEHLKNSRRDWNDIALFVHEKDAFGRLVTIHPTSNGHEQIDDETLLDLDMLQTGHSGPLSLLPTLKQVRAAIARKRLPVINSEVCYEGICGSSYADVQRYLFLSNIFIGACGHTYGANGIWQVNAVDTPYGVSPHGAQWGDTPWTQAYKLPGSTQIGMSKQFLMRFEWWRFIPNNEWVESPCSFNGLDGNYATGIPSEVRLIFQPTFGGSFWGDILIKNIEPDVSYHAFRFNPINGDIIDLGLVIADVAGNWRLPRVNAFQDWISVLINTDKSGDFITDCKA